MIGIDLVEIKRIKRLIKNKNFLSRVFDKEEISYCEKKVNKHQHYAARFAAKEAVWKVFSGKYKIALKNIVVKNLNNGKPQIKLKTTNSKIKKLKIEVSLSHTRDYAVAVAVLNSKSLKV